MERAFEIIDHTADIGIIAYGTDLKMLFSNAALGLISLLTELDTTKETIQRQIRLLSHDRESLLVNWLNELIYFFDTERIIFSRFEFDTLSEVELAARCFGNTINLKQQTIKREVKAATYHMLAITRENGQYKARIIFDV